MSIKKQEIDRKKVIGVPLWNQGENSVGATKGYLEYLKQFGTVVLLSPDSFIPEIDLLVLPGGKDVANGNKEDFSFQNSDNERFLEWFDANTLPKYIEANVPIFAICRGMQAIARHFNMPLVPNIWWDHGYSDDRNPTEAHGILYSEKAIAISKNNHVHLPKKIESYHHQGLLIKDVSDDFEILAVSDEKLEDYKIVEFMIHKTLPITCMQGHPERSHAALPKFLINSLLNR